MTAEELISELERLRDELDREYVWWGMVNVWFALGFPMTGMAMIWARLIRELPEIIGKAKGLSLALEAVAS